jgi:hypothetical protein
LAFIHAPAESADKPQAASAAREFTEISSPLQKAGAKLLDTAFPQGLFPFQTIKKERRFL